MASKKFTDKQKEIVARRMGYDGPMQGFDGFLKSDPALARKYGVIAERYMARGGIATKKPVKMAFGGTVVQASNSIADEIKEVVNPTTTTATTPTPVSTATPTPLTTTPLPATETTGNVSIDPVGPPPPGSTYTREDGQSFVADGQGNFVPVSTDTTTTPTTPTTTPTTPTTTSMPARPEVPTYTAAVTEAPVISDTVGQAPAATTAGVTLAGQAEQVTAPVIGRKWSDADAQLALSMAVNKVAPDLKYDLNNDGKITSADALAIQKQMAADEDKYRYTAEQAAPAIREELAGVEAAQGTVSQQAQVQAATQEPTTTAVGQVEAAQIAPGEGVQVGEVTPEMTVAGQLGKMTEEFDVTKPPPWAAGALRSATSQMAARGLGTSSLAGQAIVQAIFESGIPIAAADAATNVQIAVENARLAQTTDLANLNNRQTVVLAKAAQIASLETQNLSNMQQAAVANAQAFLQMDLTNLGYEQQTTLFKAQEMAQALLSDASARNAALQFNAANDLQADQFNANLAAQVSQFNASQTNALNQFNASSVNAMSQFNATQENNRDQFNAQNAVVIAQANAQLLANVSLANTAAINAANQFNAQSALGISTTAYNSEVQVMRDNMQYAWQTGENALSREMELAKTRISSEATRYGADRAVDAAMYEALGGLGSTVISGAGGIKGAFGELKEVAGAGVKALTEFFGGGSSEYELVPNYATEGDEGFGWKYYTKEDGSSIVISPGNNEYYVDGKLIWSSASVDQAITDWEYSQGADYWGGSD